MSPLGRRVISAILVILVIATGGIVAVGPSVCGDGCDDDGGIACADCPLCSPTRAADLPERHDGGLCGPAAPRESLPSLRPSRTEERDVFHVPRHLV